MTSWQTGLAVAAAVLAAATAFGLLRRRGDGKVRAQAAPTAPDLLATVGVRSGTPVTLLQFSSALCAPCRPARLFCADIAATVAGVEHVEIDVDQHWRVVRELDVRRTPTILLVDSGGRIARRSDGATTHDRLLAAVNDVLAEAKA